MSKIKCPNCGKTKTARNASPDDAKHSLLLYIPHGTKRKTFAERYKCGDTRDYLKRGRPVIEGCGCVWETNYRVTIEKKPITIIEKGEANGA